MKRILFIVSTAIVFVTFAILPWLSAQAQELEGAACIPGSDCTEGDCLMLIKVDTSCTAGGGVGRCVAIMCTAGDVNFKYCQQATSGNTCERGTTIDVKCKGCSQWAGECSNLDPDCSETPVCGDPGGTGPKDFDLKTSCI